MCSSTLIEVFGHIVFSFTRGVTEHYNPEEPEFTAESFGYDPLQSTGREWNYLPVDELIFQEYSDRKIATLDYLAASSLDVRVNNASSPAEYEEILKKGEKDEDRAMAWKRLRPSVSRTVCKSMYFGGVISLLTALIIGSVYMLVTYLCYKTILNCQFHRKESIPIQVQWMRTIVNVILYSFLFMWVFGNVLFLFRSFQLMGVKRKLILVSCFGYCLDAAYRVALQALRISHSRLSILQTAPLNALFLVIICWQICLLTSHLCIPSRKRQVTLSVQMNLPGCSCFILAMMLSSFIYPAYNDQNKEGKLLIALFSPLIGVALKVMSRISVQRLWNITHPGYSYVLLVPLYFCTAVMFRVLQADLDSLQSIAVLGTIHGAAEVIERSTMVIIDHICFVVCKRKSAPWGSFRTPRRERLMADIAIMSMLYESTAIVSVNGIWYLYQLVYLQNDSSLHLLRTFAARTFVALVIEWFFTSVSLAIETRYQNMAVMAVWRRRWKRHILVAVVNAVPLALWTSTYLLEIVHGRFNEANQPCKMPFT